MATDATGTPSTNYSIPKFNTAVDAPSGKGSNAIVDAIDAVIPFNKSMVTTKGDLIIVTASGTYARLAVGTDGQVLTADSASSGGVKWAATSAASLVTALPGSPVDGQEIIFVDSTSAPTYAWHLRYISAKASNKWQFVGGSPYYAAVETQETTTSTTYAALTTAGPSFTVPVSGNYDVRIEADLWGDSDSTSRGALMSYDIGGTGAVDGDAAFGMTYQAPASVAQIFQSDGQMRRKTGLTATQGLVSKYKTIGGGTAYFQKRRMIVFPVALGG